MRTLLLAAVLAALAAPALALKPETEAFLTKNGFDPKSPQIARIAADRVGDASLDNMADNGDRMGLKRFVATRNFIREYRKNTEYPFPQDGLYEPDYLTKDEQLFVARALQDSFSGITMKG